MPSDDVDPRATTLAAVAAGAGDAARTLTDDRRTRPHDESRDDLAGECYAHFRLERRIGQGGMGEVYLATDVALDRSVALKVLGREISHEPTSRDRFVREARAQARINHPNICHIYFIGEQHGRLFFAMELVEGESLQQRIDRMGRLAVGDALDLARMAAAGLAEAQKYGFTHRDVKPSNLLLDKHGVLKVADFGLVDTARDDDGGAIVGTPRYMAPEQARGEPVDFRADMYALGVTLHHLVEGAPPFGGETTAVLLEQHRIEPRPRCVGQTSPAFEALCDRLMAKRPEERFGSYDELLASLVSASRSRT